MLFHNLWTVVDRKDNVFDSRSGKSFDLVQDHGLVSKLDQWLREGESLLVY